MARPPGGERQGPGRAPAGAAASLAISKAMAAGRQREWPSEPGGCAPRLAAQPTRRTTVPRRARSSWWSGSGSRGRRSPRAGRAAGIEPPTATRYGWRSGRRPSAASIRQDASADPHGAACVPKSPRAGRPPASPGGDRPLPRSSRDRAGRSTAVRTLRQDQRPARSRPMALQPPDVRRDAHVCGRGTPCLRPQHLECAAGQQAGRSR